MSVKSSLGRQLGTQFDTVFDVVKSNPIYEKSGGKIPTLDLDFAKSKSFFDRRSNKNKITFARASSGTYVDGDGLIKTSPVNLLTYSEEFDNTSWAKSNSTVNANTASAPSGETTADALIENTATSTHNISKSVSVSSSTTYTFTVHAKANERSHIDLNVSGVVTTTCIVRFTLSGSGTSVLRQGSPTPTHSITDLSGGWYRCQLTFTTTSAGSAIPQVSLAPDASSSPFYTGDGVSGVYLWGAQLEEGTTASDYIPTTATKSGAPRFDHDPVTGESLGLLIEEERTNLVAYSEDYTQWISNNGTVTEGVIATPSGSNSSIRKNGGTDLRSSSVASISNSTAYTVSGYVKAVSGTISVAAGVVQEGAGTLFSVNDSEWTRVEYTFTSTQTSARLYFPSNDDFYLWGAQLEQGSFPTSYIPTDGTPGGIIRSPDIAEITGANFAKTNLLQYSERFDDAAWIKTRTSIVPNAVSAPDGLVTADKLVEGNVLSNTYYISRSVSGGNNTYINSVYAKQDESDRHLYIEVGGCRAAIDLTDGSVFSGPSTFGTGWSNPEVVVNNAGNGWYRVAIRGDADATVTSVTSKIHVATLTGGAGGILYDGNGSSGIYLWGAQLEEGSVLTDYTPSVESFVSRASSATYVDDTTGLIKTTPVNLVTYSEEFDQWNAVNTTVTANSELSPTGTQTADRCVNIIGQLSRIQNVTDLAYDINHTISVYAKPFSSNQVIAFEIGGVGGVRVDLGTGIFSGASIESGSVGDAGDGWKKVVFTFLTPSSGTVRFQAIYLGNYGASGTTSDVAFWGFQLEESSTATPYIRTTATISGAARYENGELILEEERTNLIRYNSDLNTAVPGILNSGGSLPSGWNIGQAQPGTQLQIIGTGTELGLEYIDLRFFGTPTASNRWLIQPNGSTPISVLANDEYASSLYAKLISGSLPNTVQFSVFGGPSGAVLTGGRLGSNLERHTGVGSIGSNDNRYPRLDVGSSTQLPYDFTIRVAAFQAELGSYPTSYIPTDGTPGGITRAADVSTSALGVDSLFNQDEGTFFATANKLNTTGSQRVVSNQNATAGYIVLSGSNAVSCFDGNNASVATASTYPSFTNAASVYDALTRQVAADGSLSTVVSRQVTYPLTPATELRFGPPAGNNLFNGHIKRLAYFNTRLSDDKLKSITS